MKPKANDKGEFDKYYDWPNFKAAIDNYPADQLSFDVYRSNNINQSDAAVQLMADKIVKFLAEVFGAVINVEQLKAVIMATFTNLKEAKEKGWASFSSSKEGSNSSWEYRILFATPMEGSDAYLYGLVTTILLSADIKEEESWWGLKGTTRKNFSASIDGMRLIANKDFKAPPPPVKSS